MNFCLKVQLIIKSVSVGITEQTPLPLSQSHELSPIQSVAEASHDRSAQQQVHCAGVDQLIDSDSDSDSDF